MAIKISNVKPLFGNKRSHALNSTRMRQKPNMQIFNLGDGLRVKMTAREAKTMKKALKKD